ncbi:hypothetical protein ACLMJK_004149 [Lecanora helva]
MDSPSPLDSLDPNIPSRQYKVSSKAFEKPLPPPPAPFDRTVSEAPVTSSATNTSESSFGVTRPSSSGSAFQRPRKRVIWHNKACWIALPIASDSGKKTTRADFLKPEDVAQRLQNWMDKGYDIRGFSLAPRSAEFPRSNGEGQSREVHPDPEDERREHIRQPYKVNIPDRREWEEYVNRLTEEKLRALGVSNGEEEPPRRSPVPSLMSRQGSSQSSVMLKSPALAPHSAHATTFSPNFAQGPNPNAFISKSNVSHFSRYSVALPFGEKPFSPPNTFPRSVQSPVQGPWSPQYHSGSRPESRVTSPITDGPIPRINGIVPSTSHSLNNLGHSSNQESSELFNRMRRQQALLQAQQMQQQCQQQQQIMQLHPQIAADVNSMSDPKLRLLASQSQSEVASPTPRNHHQKFSGTLRKKMDGTGDDQNSAKDVGRDEADPVVSEDDVFRDNAGDIKSAKENPLSDARPEEFGGDISLTLTGQTHDFANRQHMPQQKYLSNVSGSKLNVNAPEFKYEPQNAAHLVPSAFRCDQQIPNASETDVGSTQPHSLDSFKAKSVGVGSSQSTKFNAGAPEFTPGAIVRKPTIPSREFSFSASVPTFRPDAPAFTPNTSQAVSNVDNTGMEPSVEAKKIFGEIRFSDAAKPTRDSKAIPITQPQASSDSPKKSTLENDEQEDECGRITQADGRQKRVRRNHHDGDQVPQFASPSRDPWMNHQNDDRAACFSSTPSSSGEKADASTLEAATDLLEEIIDDLSATEASEMLKEDDSVSGDSKTFEPHAFEDIGDAADFNSARPALAPSEHLSRYLEPSPEDVAEATVNFLGRSPQFKAEFDQTLEDRNPGSLDKPGLRDGIDRKDHARQDIMDGVRYVDPSYDELDAIVKHLNEHPDHSIERRSSPSKRHGQSMSPVRSAAPEYDHMSRSPVRDSRRELSEISGTPQLLNPSNLRSDAPSPSPNRLRGMTQYLPQTDSESVNTSAIETIEQISRDIAKNPLNSPSWPAKNAIPLHRLNSPGSTPPSDWNDAISSLDEDKFHARTSFFDSRVNNLVGSVIQQRLDPLERALSGIQQSLATMSSRSASRRPRSSNAVEVIDSDADDEEDGEGLPQKRLKSPLRDRKYEQLKSTLNNIVEAQKDLMPTAQFAEVLQVVKELKASLSSGPLPAQQDVSEIKNVMEEVIGKQMRGRSAPVTSSSVAAVAEKSQLQIAGLESMLKVAENRADDEVKSRRSTEDALADSQRLLRIALQDAAEQRESAEATERTLEESSQQRQEMVQRTVILERSEERLQEAVSDLSDKNTALEDTLTEYRLSSEQWRTEIDDARHENKDLRRNISSLKGEIDENNENRQILRRKFDDLQDKMDQASQGAVAEQLRWQGKEQEHNAKLEMLIARLETETQTRQTMEHEIERLEAQGKEAVRTAFMLEQTQKVNAHFQDTSTKLRSECNEHQRLAAHFESESINAKESAAAEIHHIRTTANLDISAARVQTERVRTDLEDVIAKLDRQVEDLTLDVPKAQARHQLMLDEATKSRDSALEQAATAKETALQQQSRTHERTFKEFREQHERALRNALEDRERSETYFGNRLSLADEKVKHYQDKITHLEERLEIAKSAAHAAVQAAQNKQAISNASSSRSVTKGLEVPGKISPQALRESIAVLQEQLQARESRIEQLESDLSSVDRDAPTKLKDAEVEINWLRELLGVRIDDLEDIITTLSQPGYDCGAAKDAAIRLKANLQMEQQEKERALAGGQNFPSLTSISNLAASPKALPLAAAAAWGNWRKGREGFGNLTAVANGSVQQTPSKSSPQSFFAGLMTPPSTNIRATPPIAGNMRPLASSSSSNRAVRSPTTPRQSINARHDRGLQQDPVTPPLLRKASYDLDAIESASGFGDEGVAGSRMAEDDEEPFGPRLGGIVGTV